MKNRSRTLALSFLCFAGLFGARADAGGRPPRALTLANSLNSIEAAVCAADAAVQWIVDRADNICGLDDAKMLSRPAKVDYDALLKATSEMKRIHDEKIDPNSSEGIQLRQAAVDRVRNASERVRQTQGHCSVWKQIRHQDGRAITDITDLVKAQL